MSQATQRYTKLALCLDADRIRLPGKPMCAVPSKTDAPSLLWALPKYAQNWFWTGSAGHVHWRRGSERNRRTTSAEAECRGSHRRRIGMGRVPAAGDPYHRATHSTHPSRMPWNSEYDDRSSQEVLEPAVTSASPLRVLPNLTKRHCDWPSIPRREKHWKIRTPACYAVPDLRSSRVRDAGHRPDPAGNSPVLGLSGPDAQPNVLWLLAEVSAVVAWHRAPAALKDGEEAAHGPHWMDGEHSKTRARIAPATTTTTCESRLVPR